VTCVAAHCGGRGFIDPEYFHVFAGMTTRYENLYGDISAFNIPIRSQHYRACLQEPFRSRLLHGSDYPVPVYPHWAWMRGLIDRDALRQAGRQPSVIERDYLIKRAIGFPEDVFTRVNEILPRP
jgi:predicted TIM-barrel fold metal-dependent hydrolase